MSCAASGRRCWSPSMPRTPPRPRTRSPPSPARQTRRSRELTGPLASLNARGPPFDVVVHRRYNPEGLSRYNIVPGLIGTILTMTMVMLTGLAMTRERERGTMENLLATPVRPLEVMLGKIAPYVLIGYIQI